MHDQHRNEPDRTASEGQGEHRAQHRLPNFARLRGLGAAGGAEKDDPIDLREARQRQRADQGEAGDTQHRQPKRPSLFRRAAPQERLVDDPLAHEAVEGRQSHDRHRTHQECDPGQGHAPRQATQAVDRPRSRRPVHGARPEEQQALEERVIQRVENRPGESERRNDGQVIAHAERADPEPEKNDPDVLDAVVGEQPLQVVLGERPHDAEHPRQDPDDQHQPAPPGGRRSEQTDHAQQPVDPHLDHDARHERRDVRGGGRVRLREPEVQRYETGLEAEPDEGEAENQRSPRRQRRGARRQGIEGQRLGEPAPEGEHREQRQRARVCGDEIDEPGAPHIGLLALEDHEEVGQDSHALPGHQEGDDGPRCHHEDEGGEHDGHEEMRRGDRAMAPPPLHRQVGQSIDGARQADAEDNKKEEGRQAVDPECPRPAGEVSPFALVDRVDLAGEPIDRGAQWRTPVLLRRLVVVDPAATRRAPALDAVGAAPGRALDEVDCALRRMRVQRGSEMRQRDLVRLLQALNDGRERRVGAFVVMTKGLAVDRDARDGAGRRALEGVGPPVGVCRERTEGDVMRQSAIVHKHRDRAVIAEVDARRQAARRGLGHLMRREDRELDAIGGQYVECLAIDCRLGQPKAGGIPSEAPLEVRDAPPNFGFLVAPARKRQDDVVIGRGQRVAVIGTNHRLVHARCLPLHPIEQGRPKIKAQRRIGRDEGLVRLLGDPDIPVVLGCRRWLGVDQTSPGVLTGGLIEVPVNHGETLLRGAHPTTSAILRRTSGNTLSCAPSASTRPIVASSIDSFANARMRSSA